MDNLFFIPLLGLVDRITLNGNQPEFRRWLVGVDLHGPVEDSRLSLMGFILDLDDGRLARHHGLARVGDGHARARLGNLLYHQRRIAIVGKTKLLDKVATLTLHITEVMCRGIETHARSTLLRP